MNFNDFGCSLVTLFHIMIVNNWYVTCNMFSEIAGNDYPRFYFVAFWILVVLIMLNCVLSILIEVYGSAQEKIDEQFEKRDLALKLMNSYYGNEEELRRAIFSVLSAQHDSQIESLLE